MTNPGLIVEDRGAARWITLDRPDCRNGLTPPLVAALCEAVRSASTARVIAFAGRNDAFCSGLDLRVAAEFGPQLTANMEDHITAFQDIIRAIVQAPQPVVAVLDGPSAGFGSDLALACDLRIASTRATFQETFVRIGVIPDGGGSWMLPRLVGLSKALELILLGEKVDAATALQLGLVYKVVPPERLAEESEALVARLAAGAPMALQRAKRLARRSLETDFDTGLKGECAGQAECLRSEDVMEGVMAFFQKRPPQFQGK